MKMRNVIRKTSTPQQQSKYIKITISNYEDENSNTSEFHFVCTINIPRRKKSSQSIVTISWHQCVKMGVQLTYNALF